MIQTLQFGTSGHINTKTVYNCISRYISSLTLRFTRMFNPKTWLCICAVGRGGLILLKCNFGKLRTIKLNGNCFTTAIAIC